ncbi:putative DsbA family dithiol-disulfide isomerase [Halalkalibacter nanhaiisediminis]|uniref:Putative DsbA family dithiol-disulfide isomerase n=2 Tax=Halalkalibacter nanhaiisediminis TaxID=688079 RepID=A0A562QNB9_9BACI|nr:putative DsbA family dithiol-disulfide isomerase [Halalkalibacter nanhaiisediminis]
MMKIEIWSDFVCPFCYIGKRRLEQALDSFPHKDKVEVVYKSFELNPPGSIDTSLKIDEALAKKYGTSIEEAKRMNENVAQQAATVGLDFKFDIVSETFDAHRLAKFAESKGKATEVTERLLHAYFSENKNVGDHQVLLDLAVELGLDRAEVESVLKGNDFAKDVRIDEAEAKEIGVRGVPFFVINQKYAISGAQPPETFSSALQQVWEEESQKKTLQPLAQSNEDGAFCAEDGCEVPSQHKE